MMYVRTMSWISRKVSPTFLFLTSTILGVSYSKRKEDTFSMHFCPMAVPWVGLCPLPLLQLLCLQRGGEKKNNKKYNNNTTGVALCTSGLSGFLLCARTGFPLSISSGLGAAGALHGAGVGRGAGGCRATPLPSPHASGTEPPAHRDAPLLGQEPSLGTQGLQARLGASRDHEPSLGVTLRWRRWWGSWKRILGTGVGVASFLPQQPPRAVGLSFMSLTHVLWCPSKSAL